ncbi:MAG: hypothetical protein L6264_06815 [Weeksellaceae bacterium]|nr:hypothetical protein [Bacteroidota bacterium]MCG2780642.1 hypothetical protein [Weeksellaceae bacterium]
MNRTVKLILALLLFACLLDMAYGYYQLVRFLALVGFGILTFYTWQENKQTGILIYGELALVFQSFFKIALGRELLNIDVCCWDRASYWCF